jgi:hypothetical protein
MNIDNLTFKELKKIASMFNNEINNNEVKYKDPMVGMICVVRTYSSGVHIGMVDWINPQNSMDCKLSYSLRLWRWDGGGLSLSAVANNGIKGGRLNYTGDVRLSGAIEYIPCTKEVFATFENFIEDK